MPRGGHVAEVITLGDLVCFQGDEGEELDAAFNINNNIDEQVARFSVETHAGLVGENLRESCNHST